MFHIMLTVDHEYYTSTETYLWTTSVLLSSYLTWVIESVGQLVSQYRSYSSIIQRPATEHRLVLYKETNKMHLFVRVYSKICTLHVSNGYTVHYHEFHISLYMQLFVHIMLTVTSCSASSGGTGANFRMNTYEKVHLAGLFIRFITMHGLYNTKQT